MEIEDIFCSLMDNLGIYATISLLHTSCKASHLDILDLLECGVAAIWNFATVASMDKELFWNFYSLKINRKHMSKHIFLLIFPHFLSHSARSDRCCPNELFVNRKGKILIDATFVCMKHESDCRRATTGCSLFIPSACKGPESEERLRALESLFLLPFKT